MPNVGKSTVFNALTGGSAAVSNYPFCTVSPNRGTAPVPDQRLEMLGQRLSPEKLTPTFIEFLDVAGLVEGASRGEGLGNTFLGHIRAVDALVHVVRVFEHSDIAHVSGKVDPMRDVGLVETELILADLEIVERRLEKGRRYERLGQKEAQEEMETLKSLREQLGQGVSVRDAHVKGLPEERWKEWGLLTGKPILYVVNIGEDQVSEGERICNEMLQALGVEDSVAIPVCAKLEEELLRLDPTEQQQFREDLLLGTGGLMSLVEAGYRILRLITFYTIVGKEVRAWTLRDGETLYSAAGRIHTDMQRGFIRADVLPFEEFVRSGSEHAAREKGLIKVEGRDFVVRDGDIVRVRFQKETAG